jgi:hypothetical protein
MHSLTARTPSRLLLRLGLFQSGESGSTVSVFGPSFRPVLGTSNKGHNAVEETCSDTGRDLYNDLARYH